MEGLEAARRYLNNDWTDEDEQRLREISKLDVGRKLRVELLEDSSRIEDEERFEDIVEDIIDGEQSAKIEQLKEAYKEWYLENEGVPGEIEPWHIRKDAELDYLEESLEEARQGYGKVAFDLPEASVELESETEDESIDRTLNAKFDYAPELSELGRFSDYEVDVEIRVDSPDAIQVDPESDSMEQEARRKAREQTDLKERYDAVIKFDSGRLEIRGPRSGKYSNSKITADEYTEEFEAVFNEIQGLATNQYQ